jgi:hypothetical protein
MDWKDLGSTLLQKGLPLIGGLLGGPVGALGAKAAVSLVSSALDLEPEKTTANDVLELIQANPESLIKLKEAEMAHKERLQALLLEEKGLELKDVADARARERAIVEATGKKDLNLYVLAWTVIAGFFSLCGILMYVKLPEGSSQVVYLLFGGLVAGFSQVLGYFFGSSKSSSDKTKLLTLSKE